MKHPDTPQAGCRHMTAGGRKQTIDSCERSMCRAVEHPA